MTEYLGMTLGALIIIFAIDIGLKTRLYTRKRFWQFMIVVAVLTVLVDSYFFGRPTEIINPEILCGFYLWKAPIENVLFGVAMMWLNTILFEFLKAKRIEKIENRNEKLE